MGRRGEERNRQKNDNEKYEMRDWGGRVKRKKQFDMNQARICSACDVRRI